MGFVSDVWTLWGFPYTLEDGIDTLIRMSTTERNKYYDYRLRNLQTGEVIPGDIFG